MNTNTNGIDILLVEDNPLEAQLTIRGLKSIAMGRRLMHIENGPDALDFIFACGLFKERKLDDLPRVILLDINIPKINGLEILKRIKSDNRTKKVPVIMFTTSRESEDLNTAYELGANSYIVKPVDYTKFNATIAKLGEYWTALNELPFKLDG